VHFNNGDDNVAIKSGRDHDGRGAACPSENIIIRNCHFKGLHAVVLGSEMSAGVQNVFVEDCDYAGYCKRGLYIKTNPDRGGFIRNISFRNCTFDEVEDLFYITSMYGGEGQDNTFFTDIENITAENIHCRKARAGGLVLQGTRAKPLRGIRFCNITIGEVKNAFMASGDHLFHFVMNYTGYSIPMDDEARLVLFCQIATQYLDELQIDGEYRQYGAIEYPVIYPLTKMM
jgi:hypothetical protein